MAETAEITSEQTLEVGVDGPDDTKKMFIITGIAKYNFNVAPSAPGTTSDTITLQAHIGPALTPAKFRRAIATASLAQLLLVGGEVVVAGWSVTSVDADYDDDVGKVQLEYDLKLHIGGGSTDMAAYVTGVGFQVIILAAE
jgi:hypothetical protein